MDLNQYLIFVSIAFFYIISPGPAVFLAINYGAVHGFKKTAMMLFGNASGLAILATISAFGLGTLIVQSFILLTIVKVLGAMVLFYLGCKMLLSAVANKTAVSDKAKIIGTEENMECETAHKTTDKSKTQQPKYSDDKLDSNSYPSFYRKGLLLALSNPKAIIFFTAIFPQFMNHGSDNNLSIMLFLGLTFSCLSFICMNTYNLLGQKVLARFLTTTGMKIMNLFSGTLFVAMSGLLAFSDIGQKSR